ncbi:beta-hexosaminidase [Stenotrophomonas pictorum JCM 9942]|uniref:beta-N-acetylhexosaminidase n=1 Tax=Stenotrophomonas pictorum JCM 9942 TaxID=1236960 RepID=A0A0R0ASN2_9GAMM|nr:family 20 glycosylhydrolase [Stenotrophomonas pictorum]KRG44231.1 beta-hexosaminidase [Stenotrophomonas pictorum JCM 9942]
MTKSPPARNRAPWLGSCVLLGLTALHAHAGDLGAPLQLIPLPASYQAVEGKDFAIGPATRVAGSDATSRRVASQFISLLKQNGGPTLAVSDKANKAQIRFHLDASVATGTEGYAVKVSSNGIDVSARDEAGLFYGAVTAAQLLTGDKTGQVAAATIEDAPRFGWRGFMLDSARHFQSIDEIKKLLDAMAQHKLNTFHWHLTDDQGWRMEIKRYPKLTEVGSCRVPLGDAGRNEETGEPRTYCGFYTQEQIREIVAYAAERHIRVIPEVDVPGHATAAIAAYPELGVTDQKLVIDNQWGVFPNLFNTEESTLQFLKNVLLEVIGMFPAEYVHVGGDEAVKDQWIASARVQADMRELGLKDEMEMQSHMIKRLEKFLEQHDRRLIGWDEILEGGLPPAATVMSWRGTEGGLKAASEGHDVVMSPVTHMYMDYLQTESPNEPPGRPTTITLQKAYEFEPVPAELAADKRSHILGLQANMFSEHTRNSRNLEHNLFPRLAAVAETGWSPQNKRDFESFRARLPRQLQRYQAMDIAYAKTPFQVDMSKKGDRIAGTAEVTLDNPLGYAVRYTLDGSEVTASSPLYNQPLQLKLPTEVRVAAFFDGKPLAAENRFQLTRDSLRIREDTQLGLCPNGGKLLLRLEDDGPAEGERAIFNVNIFNPCWLWPKADLRGVHRVKVRAGRIPYNFQLAGDEPARKFVPARSTHGEMDILANCEGKPLASVPLPANPAADGFLELEAPITGTDTPTDLCIRFTGDTRPNMWTLDRVELQMAD